MKHTGETDIQYGICQWSMPSLEPAAAIRTLQELGLDGIHLNAGPWDGVRLGLADKEVQQRWRDACAGSGIHIPVLGVNALCSVGMSQPEKKDAVRTMLAGSVEIVHAMDIPLLQLPSFFDGAITTDRELETTAAHLQEVCDLAGPYGITVATENGLSAAACLKLFALTDRENLKVFFDTQNPRAMAGMNPREVLEAEYPYLCNAVHAKDGHGDTLSSALLGDGDSGFAETMAVFVEKKYKGWFILENEYTVIPATADWKANVRTDCARIKKIMAG